MTDAERTLLVWHRVLGIPPPSRRALCEARAEACRPRRVWPGLWRVPSTTTPGVVYEVGGRAGRRNCDCPAGRAGRQCKHVAAVEQQAAQQRQI